MSWSSGWVEWVLSQPKPSLEAESVTGPSWTFDLVCVTNANRQLQAMRGTIGKPKATVLADRLRMINPQAQIKAAPLYEARIADQLLGQDVDYVVDAIDNVTAKCHLLATCKERGVPVVCSTGASGRMDPTPESKLPT